MTAPALLRPAHVAAVSLASVLSDGPAVDVTGVTADSRLVAVGDLYVALPGAATHGARYAARAVVAGARAVLTDADGVAILHDQPDLVGVPIVQSTTPRALVAGLAAAIYDRPAGRLTTLGITGTNGKTTTAYLVESALAAAGRTPGLIGTLGYRYDLHELVGVRTTVTTPEAAELQALLATMAERGADSVVMEVSSHALAVGRVDAITYDVAAFTNFGRDHLDFHGSVEAYFEAKASLFTAERATRAVVNLDDPAGRVIVERVRARGDQVLVTTSLDPQSGADYRPVAPPSVGERGSELVLATPTARIPLTVGLPGDFNVGNAITALAMLDLLGVDLDHAAAGIATATVPGRMERVDLAGTWGADAPEAFVDFAHTPQAVRAALVALRQRVGGGRLVVVLGCGGDRDPDKRGPMGRIAAELADLVVVTDDNPRSEDPSAIRAAVLAGALAAVRDGVREGARAEVLDGGDRATAIGLAVAAAGPTDLVAVLGKGHEEGQELDGQVLPFSDRAQLRSARPGVDR